MLCERKNLSCMREKLLSCVREKHFSCVREMDSLTMIGLKNLSSVRKILSCVVKVAICCT